MKKYIKQLRKQALAILLVLMLTSPASLLVYATPANTQSWQNAFATFLQNEYMNVTNSNAMLVAGGWADPFQIDSEHVGFTFALEDVSGNGIPNLLVNFWNVSGLQIWVVNIYEYQQGRVVRVASREYGTRIAVGDEFSEAELSEFYCLYTGVKTLAFRRNL